MKACTRDFAIRIRQLEDLAFQLSKEIKCLYRDIDILDKSCNNENNEWDPQGFES